MHIFSERAAFLGSKANTAHHLAVTEKQPRKILDPFWMMKYLFLFLFQWRHVNMLVISVDRRHCRRVLRLRCSCHALSFTVWIHRRRCSCLQCQQTCPCDRPGKHCCLLFCCCCCCCLLFCILQYNITCCEGNEIHVMSIFADSFLLYGIWWFYIHCPAAFLNVDTHQHADEWE